MTNNNEKCCRECNKVTLEECKCSAEGKHKTRVFSCKNTDCPCHTKTQEEWENKIIPEYSSIAVLDEDAFIGYYVEPAILFITNLLRTERERAVSEHDAKWHPLVKGTMVNMHGFKEGRQQAFAEVKVMVEGMKRTDDTQMSDDRVYDEALTDLFTKLEEK